MSGDGDVNRCRGQELDPYTFLAVLGKQVIHPGGRASTDRLLEWAAVQPGERVLDFGCGVGSTDIRLARECGAEVIAADIAPLMRARISGIIRVQEADILALPYPRRVVRRGGCRGSDDVREPTARRWRARARRTTWGSGPRDEVLLASSPTEEARHLLLGEVCPGLRFDSVEEWEEIYAGAGLVDVRAEAGPYAMMTLRGFLTDEGGTQLP